MKVAEADIVVVTVRPQRMSRDDALILKDGFQESTVSYSYFLYPKNESLVKT